MLTATIAMSLALGVTPVTERGDHHDWIVRMDVCVGRFHESRRDPYKLPGVSDGESAWPLLPKERLDRFSDGETCAYFPLIEDGPYHESALDLARGALRLDDLRADLPIELVPGDSPSERFGCLRLPAFTTTRLELQFVRHVRAFESVVDEPRAAQCAWWNHWPADVAAFLRPEPYIESDDPQIVELVRSWLGTDPWTIPPYVTAKAITGKVIESVQVSGRMTTLFGDHFIRGFNVKGAKRSLVDASGTSADLCCAVVACLRAAGIPARLVIGVTREAELTVWVEFCIHDAEAGTNHWIPIDVDRLRGHSTRMQPLDRTWDDFGSLNDLEDRIPLTYHLRPSRGSLAGRPSLWSWDAASRPEGRKLTHLLVFHVQTAPKRADSPAADD
ncbi:MAG: transglutaminase domain-containing protein [Phycisphaerales bacterium]|nr:transglutaminase domain-containing protein [Phycisphaerales bacterium]